MQRDYYQTMIVNLRPSMIICNIILIYWFLIVRVPLVKFLIFNEIIYTITSSNILLIVDAYQIYIDN